MMKKLYSLAYSMLCIMLLSVPICAQENGEYINFTFDFSGFTEKSIAARVFIFSEAVLELEAGNTGEARLKKRPEYYIRIEYFERCAGKNIFSSDPVTLRLQPAIDEYSFVISDPPANLSGRATVTFLNGFDESVRVYVINSNNEYGYIGGFDDTRDLAGKNSVIAPRGSDTFIIPAARYKIEVRKTDNAGTKIYDLDYIDLLSAIESSIIELSPDMVDGNKRQPVRAVMYYPPNTSPDAIPLLPEFVLQFSAPMIVPPVVSQLTLTGLENPRVKIPLKLIWSNDNKSLRIQPIRELDYDTEYSLNLGIDAYDRWGNRLARVGEWKFATLRNNVPALAERVKTGIVFDGTELTAMEQRTLTNALRQGLVKAGVQMEISPGPQDAANDGYNFLISLNSIATVDAPAYFGNTNPEIRGYFSVEFMRNGLTLHLEVSPPFQDSSRELVVLGAANWIRDNRNFYEEAINKLAQ